MSVSNAHAVSKLVAVERVDDQVRDWVSTEIWGEQYFYWFATSSKKSDFFENLQTHFRNSKEFSSNGFSKIYKKNWWKLSVSCAA